VHPPFVEADQRRPFDLGVIVAMSVVGRLAVAVHNYPRSDYAARGHDHARVVVEVR
jgi:hypothetical protein